MDVKVIPPPLRFYFGDKNNATTQKYGSAESDDNVSHGSAYNKRPFSCLRHMKLVQLFGKFIGVLREEDRTIKT